MSDCQCPASRQLGEGHVPPCPLANVVQIYRNPETDRPVAVPQEIVTEAEREYRAYLLHLQGKTWTEIAIIEMYPSGEAASEAVRRYLDEGRAVVGNFRRQEVLAVEIATLRAMRAAMWDEATLAHKPSAVMAILATHDRMMKAFGLDQPSEEDTTVETVVVPSEDYIASLEEASRGQTLEPTADAG